MMPKPKTCTLLLLGPARSPLLRILRRILELAARVVARERRPVELLARVQRARQLVALHQHRLLRVVGRVRHVLLQDLLAFAVGKDVRRDAEVGFLAGADFAADEGEG